MYFSFITILTVEYSVVSRRVPRKSTTLTMASLSTFCAFALLPRVLSTSFSTHPFNKIITKQKSQLFWRLWDFPLFQHCETVQISEIFKLLPPSIFWYFATEWMFKTQRSWVLEYFVKILEKSRILEYLGKILGFVLTSWISWYYLGFHFGYLDKILDSILDFFEDLPRTCKILARYSRCRTLGYFMI